MQFVQNYPYFTKISLTSKLKLIRCEINPSFRHEKILQIKKNKKKLLKQLTDKKINVAHGTHELSIKRVFGTKYFKLDKNIYISMGLTKNGGESGYRLWPDDINQSTPHQ